MGEVGINRHNVGRIAERIVANELEYRGFRVSDLNKEGLSANADLLAARDGKTFQIQVKGATEDNGWWVNYGFAIDAIIQRKRPMFNAASGFYVADFVVLVSVKSPADYICVVLPEEIAEKTAQINLDREFRTPKKNGQPKKPGKVWSDLDYIPRTKDAARRDSFKAEQEVLKSYLGRWNNFGASA
ncbi:MAG: hypothetical protein WAM66_06920 [Acidobacteriaceae bacterium]